MSIFEEPWWISAATDDVFHRVSFEGGGVRAEMVLAPSRDRRLGGFSMPLYARVSDPKILFGNVRPKNPLAAQTRALRGLMDGLPSFEHLSYTLSPGSDLVLAHQLCGFKVTPAYTFRLEPGSDALSLMDQKIRYNVLKGRERIAITRHDDVEAYIRLSKSFVRDRSLRNGYDYGAIGRIYRASAGRDMGTIISAVDRRGDELASAILLYDERTLYYWMNCRDPRSSDYTANSILIAEAARIAGSRNLVFDMDGYASPNAGTFLSRFGFTPTPRHDIRYDSPRSALRQAQYGYVAALIGPERERMVLAMRNRASDFLSRGKDAPAGPRGPAGIAPRLEVGRPWHLVSK